MLGVILGVCWGSFWAYVGGRFGHLLGVTLGLLGVILGIRLQYGHDMFDGCAHIVILAHYFNIGSTVRDVTTSRRGNNKTHSPANDFVFASVGPRPGPYRLFHTYGTLDFLIGVPLKPLLKRFWERPIHIDIVVSRKKESL